MRADTVLQVSDSGSDHDLSTGWIAKIRRVDRTTGRIHFDRADGASGSFWDPDYADFEPGTVLLLPEDGNTDAIEVLPATDWPRSETAIGIVKLISEDDSTAILEVNGRYESFEQRADPPFAVGQTIALDQLGRPEQVLSSKPIDRFGLREDRDAFDPADYQHTPGALNLEDFGGSTRLVNRALELSKVALDAEERLAQIGVNPVKGILFSGPSGTGKTHLARVLSSTLGATFYLVDGPEIINKWVGESEERLRLLFKHAADNAPSIVFFDELDSIVASRGDGAPEYASRFVGQFLTALDGFTASRQVLVIATTNLPGALDTALLRPGRLTFKLEFDGQPGPQDRLKILQASARGVKGSENADWNHLVETTEGWSAAELAMIWTEAGVLAVLDERTSLCTRDVEAGIDRARDNREISRRQEAS